MPHLHLSLQSGDDMILKRMKRRHLRAHSIAFCEEVRRFAPISFSAPISSPAFRPRPTRCFENSLEIVDECGLTYPSCLSVFAPARHAGGAHAAGREGQ